MLQSAEKFTNRVIDFFNGGKAPSESLFQIDSENQPKVRFLYWAHSPENAEELASKIKDADTVLVELVGGSSEERETLERNYNLILKEGYEKASQEVQISSNTTLFKGKI